MLRVGLTGGIGSGKSTVARAFVAHGAALIDADQISRASTAAGGSAIDAITRTFGADFIDSTVTVLIVAASAIAAWATVQSYRGADNRAFFTTT